MSFIQALHIDVEDAGPGHVFETEIVQFLGLGNFLIKVFHIVDVEASGKFKIDSNVLFFLNVRSREWPKTEPHRSNQMWARYTKTLLMYGYETLKKMKKRNEEDFLM